MSCWDKFAAGWLILFYLVFYFSEENFKIALFYIHYIHRILLKTIFWTNLVIEFWVYRIYICCYRIYDLLKVCWMLVSGAAKSRGRSLLDFRPSIGSSLQWTSFSWRKTNGSKNRLPCWFMRMHIWSSNYRLWVLSFHYLYC